MQKPLNKENHSLYFLECLSMKSDLPPDLSCKGVQDFRRLLNYVLDCWLPFWAKGIFTHTMISPMWISQIKGNVSGDAYWVGFAMRKGI